MEGIKLLGCTLSAAAGMLVMTESIFGGLTLCVFGVLAMGRLLAEVDCGEER